MKKRLSAVFFIAVFLGSVIFVIIEGSKPEVLPVGSKMPAITITTKTTEVDLPVHSKRKVLLVYFSKNCSHCVYQLKVLNENINKFREVDIYLVTTDYEYLDSNEIESFSNLTESENVLVGKVEREEYKNLFGSMITPSLFFFNGEEVLTAKLKGETKIDRMLQELYQKVM